MSDLPAEVIAEILSRLPVKPVLQFRCVSKPWCALIDSPHFIRSHLNRSMKTNTNRSFIFRAEDLYSVDLDSLDHAAELDNPMKNEEGTKVVVSFHGLVVLSKPFYQDVTLWNPSTRKHRKLPVSQVEFPRGWRHFNYIVFGLGFDSVNDDYKLVRMVQFVGKDDDDSFHSEVKVYSLKLNRWRRVQDFPYYLAYEASSAMTFNGSLHWLVTRKPKSDRSILIAAFDLGVEEYRLVPLPDYMNGDLVMNVDALGGCLCVVCNYYGDQTDIWVMKEYGVRESWTKLFSVTQSIMISPFFYLMPLAYSKSGGEVLLQKDNASLFWYDLRKEKVSNIRIHGLKYFVEAYICVESLVPLHGDGGRDCKKQQTRKKMMKQNNRREGMVRSSKHKRRR
ncbi:F-box protein CPR1-like [Cornus florida]|uniref:F-box protein CPR1-like n=1 Tax=Cornus florida TaxID=4283 RepID=UPI00289F1C71|nr:F-box protein CPR1-like [Cornus florida]XP_059653867.1 F-box protein CPR1-like [Cornus florida]XP_059653868.1 F-box protein CPR1-like [Cornus florida]